MTTKLETAIALGYTPDDSRLCPRADCCRLEHYAPSEAANLFTAEQIEAARDRDVDDFLRLHPQAPRGAYGVLASDEAGIYSETH